MTANHKNPNNERWIQKQTIPRNEKGKCKRSDICVFRSRLLNKNSMLILVSIGDALYWANARVNNSTDEWFFDGHNCTNCPFVFETWNGEISDGLRSLPPTPDVRSSLDVFRWSAVLESVTSAVVPKPVIDKSSRANTLSGRVGL